MKLPSRILKPTSLKRGLFFLAWDFIVICLSLYLAFYVRLEFSVPSSYLVTLIIVLPLFVVVKLLALSSFRIYRITWRYVGLTDLFKMIAALTISEILLTALVLWMQVAHTMLMEHVTRGVPRSVFLLDFLLTVSFVSIVRLSKRITLEVLIGKRSRQQSSRVFIVGAGNTGELVLREMQRYRFSKFYPIGLLDDDLMKVGSYIHGVKVLGTVEEMERLIPVHRPDSIIIAIPSLDFRKLRRIYDSARNSGIKTIKIIPRIYDYHKPQINLRALEDINIEDLIGREVISVDWTEIGELLRDKSILVTGAAGSIGSEIVMQVCGFDPRQVVLYDFDETGLFNMGNKLQRTFPDRMSSTHLVVGSVLDEARLESVFERLSPDVVFHAAAYKHVPMMEYNPTEAVRTNIFGTYNVAKAAVEHGVKKFIMISTDKAVRPTSVMGATKRLAENICAAFNSGANGFPLKHTEFISVRFGNVLGSRGSVLPLFMEQLKRGGPLTVTHRDMKRYFMTIPEAVTLVLQASFIGKGGEVLVLDMGKPVGILDLAEELIRIHGMKPYEDIGIEFVGLRPGEKLFEEILTAEEGTTATRHEKIYVAKNTGSLHIEDVELILKDFDRSMIVDGEEVGLRVKSLLKKYVEYFREEPETESGIPAGPHGVAIDMGKAASRIINTAEHPASAGMDHGGLA